MINDYGPCRIMWSWQFGAYLECALFTLDCPSRHKHVLVVATIPLQVMLKLAGAVNAL